MRDPARISGQRIWENRSLVWPALGRQQHNV